MLQSLLLSFRGGWKWGAGVEMEAGVEMGGMRLKKSLPQLSTTPPTRGPPVEAECVVNERVFTGICEPHIPE